MAQKLLEKGTIAEDMRNRTPFRLEPEIATLAGTYTLTTLSTPMQVLDPGGGAKDVFLPDAAEMEGSVFLVINSADGAENLVVKSGDATSSTTISTVAQAESALVVSDGVSWHGLIGGQTT